MNHLIRTTLALVGLVMAAACFLPEASSLPVGDRTLSSCEITIDSSNGAWPNIIRYCAFDCDVTPEPAAGVAAPVVAPSATGSGAGAGLMTEGTEWRVVSQCNPWASDNRWANCGWHAWTVEFPYNPCPSYGAPGAHGPGLCTVSLWTHSPLVTVTGTCGLAVKPI